MIGCIDGTFAPIQTPAKKTRQTYTNRHHQTSITLQGVCDHKRKFLDVFAGCPGRMHDARVYGYSDLHEELPLLWNRRFHVLGDGAYPIREWLLKPFRDRGHLTDEQRAFNRRLSSTRVKIENAFGLLKGRFLQLKYGLRMHTVPKMSKFIVACCVLHNLCIEDQPRQVLRDVPRIPRQHNLDDEENYDDVNVVDRLLQRRGERKRRRILQSFQE